MFAAPYVLPPPLPTLGASPDGQACIARGSTHVCKFCLTRAPQAGRVRLQEACWSPYLLDRLGRVLPLN
eukprot:2332357-Amphidinium_carterae.1